jgi:excisionase family DNA binding protein
MLLTIKEAAERIAFRRVTLYWHIAQKHLEAVKIWGRVLVEDSELQAFAERYERGEHDDRRRPAAA